MHAQTFFIEMKVEIGVKKTLLERIQSESTDETMMACCAREHRQLRAAGSQVCADGAGESQARPALH